MTHVVALRLVQRMEEDAALGNDNTILQSSQSVAEVAELVGYDTKELRSIPEASILGAGCGTPTKFAYVKEGDTVVDLGSGAGIDEIPCS